MLASVILDRAKEVLLDPTGNYWTAPELLDYLNAGINTVILVKPDAYTTTESMSLTTSTPKQTIPTGGHLFLDLTRNLTPGTTAITEVGRNRMDHDDPSWPTVTTATAIKHFMTDPRNPKVFYVYPVPSVSMTVEVEYVKTPTRLTAASDAITLDDVYETPLFCFVLALAYAKNSKRQDLQKTAENMQMFTTLLGARSQIQLAESPMVPEKHP